MAHVRRAAVTPATLLPLCLSLNPLALKNSPLRVFSVLKF